MKYTKLIWTAAISPITCQASQEALSFSSIIYFKWKDSSAGPTYFKDNTPLLIKCTHQNLRTDMNVHSDETGRHKTLIISD